MAAFELSFSIISLKKETSWRIALALNSLFHAQIQEPKSRLTTMTSFAFLAKFAEFYYHKMFETRS